MKWAKQLKRRLNGKGPGRSEQQRLGDGARNRGDWATAAIHYQRHLARNRADFDIWVQLGHALKETARFEDADKAYQAAHALNPRNADLLLCRGHLAKMGGDATAALHFYSLSFEIDGNHHAKRELPDAAILNAPQTHQIFDAPQPAQIVGQIDRLSGSCLVGWIVDIDREPEAAEVELLVNGEVIAVQQANIIRKDVNRPGFARTPVGFRIDLKDLVSLETSPWVSARLRRTGEMLQGSPFHLAPQPEIEAWKNRTRPAAAHAKGNSVLLSVLFEVDALSARRVTEVIASVQAQTSGDWEMICVANADASAAVVTALTRAAEKDPRVRLVHRAKSTAESIFNSGVKAAKGQTLLFLSPKSALEPEAVDRFLHAAAAGADLIYADEVIIDSESKDVETIITRPAFSYDRLLSHPCLGETFAMRAETARAAVAANGKSGSAALYALALSAVEAGGAAAHIPALLVRSISSPLTEPDNDSLAAVNKHLQRQGAGFTARLDADVGAQVVSGPDGRPSSTLILIPVQSHQHLRACLDNIDRLPAASGARVVIVGCGMATLADKTTLDALAKIVSFQPHQPGANVAAMLNLAVRSAAPTDHLLFMNSAMQPTKADWLSPLTDILSRPDIGVVAPTIINADKVICDIGLGLGTAGLIDLAAISAPLHLRSGRNPGPGRILLSRRNVSALSLNAFMIRSDVFNQAGGFEETLPASLASIDLCLRLGASGFQILVDPVTVMQAHGDAPAHPALADMGDGRVFANRWRNWAAKDDPFYSPLRAPQGDRRIADLTDMGRAARVRPMSASPDAAKARMSIFAAPSWFHGARPQ